MLIILLCLVPMLTIIWWCIRCYLGNMAATFILLIIIGMSIVIFNFIKDPSKEELNQFKESRKGVGY